MMQMIKPFLAAVVMALSGAVTPAVAQSNNPFSPLVFVNNQAITWYELEQRKILLKLFRAAGDLDKQARDGLIDDRLRMDAAKQLGQLPSDEAVLEGMEEFAGRANLSKDEFVRVISSAGASEESYRDFIRAGVAWRGVVRVKFGPRAQVTEAEVDRAIALTAQGSGAEVLISEIILPANTPAAAARAESLAAQIRNTVKSEAGFASFARRYSASGTRGAGGRVAKAIPVANLPPNIAALIITLAPGEVSEPVPVPNAIALFQLRDLREVKSDTPQALSVEYAQYFIPGGRSDAALNAAAKVAAKVDTCDDLYGIAKKQPPEALVIETQALDAVPGDIAMELAQLDEGEHSTALTRGDNLMFLMLCGRVAALAEDVDRAAVRERLVNQRVASYADGFLAELRADAIIREP